MPTPPMKITIKLHKIRMVVFGRFGIYLLIRVVAEGDEVEIQTPLPQWEQNFAWEGMGRRPQGYERDGYSRFFIVYYSPCCRPMPPEREWLFS